MSEKFETKVVRKIVSDDKRLLTEVEPDRDGLGLVQIRDNIGSGTETYLTFPPDMARLVAKAILACADEIDKSPMR